MSRAAIISAGLCLGLGALPALAQGVPTQDNSAIRRAIARVTALAEDLGVQQDKDLTESTLADVQADQLRVLEEMTAAITGPGFDIRALEGNADFGVAAVYPNTDASPMNSRLFGEGRETVEMMIVEVAGEFAGAPGVARAGLSATQWRCLFQALIKQESRFNVTAQSPVGAYGLTQLMPGTASDLGVDRYDVKDNLRGGARYITTQLGRFGNIPHALAAGSSSCGVLPFGVCIRMTKPKQSGAFLGHRFPPEIIAYTVWAYHRFPMSLRDVEDLLAARGITVSYESIRAWVAKFGSQYAKLIRRDRPKVADKWHLDEVVLPINGKKYWLWRAVDSNGDVLDILVQARRNKRAADRFFRKLFKAFGEPRVVVTDKLRSYGAALKKLAPGIEHRSHKGLNNRSEGSHRPTRRREKIMGRFKSPRQAQQFLSVHDQVQTVFRPRRHTLSATCYRQSRADAHWIWDDITRELKAA